MNGERERDGVVFTYCSSVFYCAVRRFVNWMRRRKEEDIKTSGDGVSLRFLITKTPVSLYSVSRVSLSEFRYSRYLFNSL